MRSRRAAPLPRALRRRLAPRCEVPVLPALNQPGAVEPPRLRHSSGGCPVTEMIGVDVGGTFTDVAGIEAGLIKVAKVPTDVVASDTSVLAGAMELGVGEAAVFNLASTA